MDVLIYMFLSLVFNFQDQIFTESILTGLVKFYLFNFLEEVRRVQLFISL